MPSQNQLLKKGALTTIINAGLLAGFMDGLAAIVTNLHLNPLSIFRYIASGVLGNSAFSGGVLTAMVGILFHFIIAASWALIFFLIYPKINWFSKSDVITGVFYGLVIWLVMNLIVVPVSRTPPVTITFGEVIVGIAILMLCAGIPISLIIGKYYKITRQIDDD
ncbi:MAG: hypothetical protein R6W90_18345 [Ignavibacteriaceae bacterium]